MKALIYRWHSLPGWRLHCVDCGLEKILDIEDIVTAAHKGREEGWTVIAYGLDRCPVCTEKHEKLRESAKEIHYASNKG